MKYEFTAKVWNYSSTVGTGGWHIACLPKEMSKEIRENLGFLEEGWGRLKMTAKTGNTQWETAIWFDTKLDTYLLPLKAEIRKKEKIEESVLKTYQASNPSLYYVYEVIGDYYEAMQQSKQAIAYWQQALKKSIPKLQEKERIQQKIQKQSKDGKES